MALLSMLGGTAQADTYSETLKTFANAALDKPGVRSPFPCDDGWLASSKDGYVVDVAPWAEQAGLRRGDRLLSFGSERVLGGDWTEALSRFNGRGVFEIRVERSGREINLQLPCRDNREQWRSQRDMFLAIASERWDDCLEAANRLRNLWQRPYSILFRTLWECSALKARSEKKPIPEDVWRYYYTYHSRRLVESTSRPHGLENIRSETVSAIDSLARNGKVLYAADLKQQLEKLWALDAPRREEPLKQEELSRVGTGFAIRPDGLLMTARHVVESAERIEVRCPGIGAAPAVMEKSSAATDLAVLRLTGARPLAYLNFADPKTVQVGTHVFTVGYPAPDILGKEAKFTEGAISALSGVGGEESLLQISAPIQPGNSGGPLLNERGEVIGVVLATADAAVFLGMTGSLPQNVSWAVKSSYALPLFEAPPRVPSGSAPRSEIIQKAINATCLIIAQRKTER